MSKICLLDIDGVLNHYPQGLLDYINEQLFGVSHFKTLCYAKSKLTYNTYSTLQREWLTDGCSSPIRRDARLFTEFLALKGYKIIIATMRNPKLVPKVIIKTVDFLDEGRLQYHDLMFVRNKIEVLARYPNIEIAVEDDGSQANALARCGIVVFLMGGEENRGAEMSLNIKYKESFEEIVNHWFGESLRDPL